MQVFRQEVKVYNHLHIHKEFDATLDHNNTVTRVYTLPDANGTIALTTDTAPDSLKFGGHEVSYFQPSIGYTPANDATVVHTSEKGAANGVAPLDSNARLLKANRSVYTDAERGIGVTTWRSFLDLIDGHSPNADSNWFNNNWAGDNEGAYYLILTSATVDNGKGEMIDWIAGKFATPFYNADDDAWYWIQVDEDPNNVYVPGYMGITQLYYPSYTEDSYPAAAFPGAFWRVLAGPNILKIDGVDTTIELPCWLRSDGTKWFADNAETEQIPTFNGRVGDIIPQSGDYSGFYAYLYHSHGSLEYLSKIFMGRNQNPTCGQLWYSLVGYNAWQNYMGPALAANQGYYGNITTPNGTFVKNTGDSTGWALRSFIENTAGYGWTWESGVKGSTTPAIIAELSSATGNFRTIGSITSASGTSTIGGTRFYTGSGDGILTSPSLRFNSSTNTFSINSVGSGGVYFNLDFGIGGVFFGNGSGGVVGSVDANGNASFTTMNVTSGTNSTSTVTGSIKTPGGLGVGGNFWLGGTLNGYGISQFVKDGDVMMPNNPFGGRKFYWNGMMNALHNAEKRWTVTGKLYLIADDTFVGDLSQAALANLFDGNYETSLTIPVGKYAVILIDFTPDPWTYNGIHCFNGYPYGSLYVSHYNTGFSASISHRVYVNYPAHGLGWTTPITFTDFFRGGAQLIQVANEGDKYAISQMEITIKAPTSGNDALVTQIDFALNRPGTSDMPSIDKFKAPTFYQPMTLQSAAPSIILNAVGGTTPYAWKLQSSNATGQLAITDITASATRMTFAPTTGNVGINSTTESTAYTNGSLTTSGGAGFGGNVYVKNDLFATNGTFGGTTDTANRSVTIRNAAGYVKSLTFTTGTTLRWKLSSNGTAESGSNNGANFEVAAYDDAGALIDIPISIIRKAGGLVTIPRQTSFTDTTEATAYNAASVIHAGGIGVGGHIFVKNNVYAGSAVFGSGTDTVNRTITVRTAAGYERNFAFYTGANCRWKLTCNSNAETGSDAGSTLSIDAYTDAGAFIDSPMSVIRAAGGTITFSARPVVISGQTLSVGASAAAAPAAIAINSAAGYSKNVTYRTAGSLRWSHGSDNSAEGGSNAGSNFLISAYSDTGVWIDNPIVINRVAGGTITFARPAVFTGTLKAKTLEASGLGALGGLILSDESGNRYRISIEGGAIKVTAL